VKHVAKRIEYAKIRKDWPVEKWRHILWSDESKIGFFGWKGSRSYVRRPPRTENNPRFTFKTVKHWGSNIMVWACFSYYGVDPIHMIQGIMDQHIYTDILENVMALYAEDEMPFFWTFQQDNDPKHTRKKARKWFEQKSIRVMISHPT